MGTILEKALTLKSGQLVKIRNVLESDAESYLNLGKMIMSEQQYTLTQPEELTTSIEEE